MPLANPATTLTTANQAVIISYSQRSTGPGPGPCHWRNAGPMLLADDTHPYQLNSGGWLTSVREVNAGACEWMRPAGRAPVVVTWCCQLVVNLGGQL